MSTSEKHCVFEATPPHLGVGERRSVSGVPGEGLVEGKSGFRVGRVAKSLKIVKKSTKIGSRGRPESDLRGQRRKSGEKDVRIF